MNIKLSIREWSINFMMDIYTDQSTETQIKAGWYDWFCKCGSLRNKTYKMGKIISKINGKGKVDIDSNYVWFKNNCPLCYGLYDDFRIASMEDGEVQMTVVIDCEYEHHKYTVYGRKEKGGEFYDYPLFEADDSRELVKWLNEPWEN